jgi:hypothetical protein
MNAHDSIKPFLKVLTIFGLLKLEKKGIGKYFRHFFQIIIFLISLITIGISINKEMLTNVWPVSLMIGLIFYLLIAMIHQTIKQNEIQSLIVKIVEIDKMVCEEKNTLNLEFFDFVFSSSLVQ